jgi:hypothetical protein
MHELNWKRCFLCSYTRLRVVGIRISTGAGFQDCNTPLQMRIPEKHT